MLLKIIFKKHKKFMNSILANLPKAAQILESKSPLRTLFERVWILIASIYCAHDKAAKLFLVRNEPAYNKYTPFRFKRDNLFQYFSLMKSSKNKFYFLTCILPDYVAHKSSKFFWKNIHFENMRAGFLLSCQNSLRQTTHKMMHFEHKNFDHNQYYVVAFDPIKI